ncbi:Integral membrane sensor hybrid histidine kinase [uncultured Paludibacter sp.]|uniref:histidine kinase n=1 Tax=uncultured Paludibacter sp. TaxID=497635 RepID=A0A653AL16_9BACT|nr:Integral membrane sensor hybrid histidine kinase [uncultured Paludibacter sp.]
MSKRVRVIIIALVFVAEFVSALTESPLVLEKFPLNDKLPSNSVTRIYNDKEGYMWLGTKDGLCRYDGYDIKVFRSSALTPEKLTNNEIECLEEDDENKIWIGTYEGINIFDKNNYSIKPLKNKYTEKERINYIFKDSKGFIWVGTSRNGILRINSVSGEYERFSTDKDSRLKLKGNNVKFIYEDKDGTIWIALWKDGLCAINQNLTNIYYAPTIGTNDNPFRMMEDKDGMYWICTWGDGIYNMTVDGKMKINFTPVSFSNNPDEKVDNIVYSILQDDKYGYIWMVTFKGLRIIKKEADRTYSLEDNNYILNSSHSQLFHDIYKDRHGNLWFGSVGEGLYMLDFNKLSIQNYTLGNLRQSLNTESFVTRLCDAGSGNLYVVINRFGLIDFNLSSGTIKRLSNPVFNKFNSIIYIDNITKTNEIWIANEGEDKIYVFKQAENKELTQVNQYSVRGLTQIPYISITNFFEDFDGNVWIGTSDALFKKPYNSTVQLISTKIQSVSAIQQDLDRNIWIGTEKDGLFILKPKVTGNKTTYSVSKLNLNIKNYQSLSIQSICCKRNGDIFIGTKEGGIFYYDKKTQVATEISGQYGITDERILDIVEDNFGYLWISTAKKIIRYNPLTHASSYYSSQNGVSVTTFYKNSFIRLKTGQLLFGGNNGIVEFNPTNQISSKKIVPNVVLTDILIENKSIYDDTDNKHFVSQKNKIEMKYSENNLSIEFAALNQLSASKSQYAYKLSGINNEWNYVGNNRRYVNYADLPVGKYTFMVKASDENGQWSDKVTTLKIVVLPPFYRTWWAYLFYLLLLGITAYFTYRTFVNRIRLRNDLRISRIEKEKSEELTQIKLRYFTNITHELLTPLTIIMLQIEKMQNKFGGDPSQYDIMKENVNRLNRLIKQILVFRKTESGNLKLNVSKDDIVAYVYNICQSNFRPLVNEKEINFTFDSEYEHYIAYFDADKLDKIIYNILSNAFKHTPKKGNIAVKISFIDREKEVIMSLSVADTGEGIDENDLPHIFKRFYISRSADQSKSHGIGLALTYDLVQLHKGSINVKSQLGEGSVFTVEIPVSINAYTEEELAPEQNEDIEESVKTTQKIYQENIATVKEQNQELTPEKLTILIIEDNTDLRNLMMEFFSNEYNVLTAENGAKGLEVLTENQDLDLIISDVMMPEMDGLTFCKTIKNNIKTSHINILLLTAKNSTQDRIECYNAGADSYISKPFEFDVVNARVKNLIRKRRQKAEGFQKAHDINISSMEYSSMDEQFLTNAVKVVENRLSDETLNFDDFAASMAVAKSTLHRKLKTLTGLSPVEFIRNIRLKHATQMLESNTGNISEIAFSVGFNDPKYFSRCFKNEFGMTPKEYQEAKKTK